MLPMKNKLTLLIFDAAGTPVRQTTFPKILLPLAALIMVGVAIALYMGLSDYLRLKTEASHVKSLRLDLQTQAERVAHQQSQIVAFSNKIESLKTHLNGLRDFEQKIRIIANLEAGNAETSMFGVGGSDPEDLDPTVIMEQDYQELVRDMHAEINEIDQTSYTQNESFASLFDQLKGKRNLLAATPSIRPLKGWVTSQFGYRESPFTGRREFHRGLDIAARAGTPIFATADGLVTFADNKGLMGKMVTIEHGFGMMTRFGHIQEILTKKGDRVKRGDTIALVGSTGRSTGPHVHYEVRINGVNVNPTSYFLN